MAKANINLRKELENRIRFETLISDLSAGFINTPADQVDSRIEDAQRRVCECLGLDLSALWQHDDEAPGDYRLTHHYRSIGGPVIEQISAKENFPWCQKQLMAGKLIAVSSMDKLPPEATRDQEVWRHYGVKTSLTLPLSTGGNIAIGFLSFNDMREERTWPELLIQRLQLVAQMFANALARKNSEKVLRESEERLNTALGAAGAGVWSLDVESRQVWVSPSERKLFGFSDDEYVPYDRFIQTIYPEDREYVKTVVENTLQNKTPLFVEYRIVSPDGHIFWISSRGRYQCNPNTKSSRLIGVSVNVTDRKRAQIALEESRTQISAIINSTEDLIWSVDPRRFGLLTWNKTLRAYFFEQRGIDIRVGMTPEELLPPDYAARWREFYKNALRDGFFTTEYVVAAGTKILLLSIHAMKRGQEVFAISVFGRDITQQKQADKALRESGERLRLVLEANSEGVWDWQIQTGEAYFSPHYSGMLGYTSEEFATSYISWKELVHPDDFERVNKAHKDHIYGHKDFCVELRMRKKSGKWCWILSRGMVVERDAQGNAVRMVGTHTDITERKLAELKLRESEERLNLATDSAGVGLWSLDADSHKMWVTPRFRELLLLMFDEEINYKSLLKKIHPEDREMVRQALEQSFQTKENLYLEHRVVFPDGGIRWIGVRGHPYFKSSGKPDRLMGVSIDITERKRIEEKLRTNEDALHKLAGKMLTAQEEERRRLARELHDDLSQRLAVLAIDAGKLEKQPRLSPSQIVNRFKHIREQLVAISTDVHDISRQLHPSIIDDLGLVDAMKSECSIFSKRENIDVRFKPENVPSKIPRDIALCLYRVSQEALRNIKKHARTSKAAVILIGNNNELVLRVRDQGAGFQLEKAHHKTGLGLASMEERVRLINGKFVVKSEIGAGTTIEVRVSLQEK